MYQWINYLKGRQAWLACGILAFGAIYGLGERVFAVDPHDRHMGEYLLVACVFSIFLTAIKPWDKQIVSHWSMKPFQWCGKISYSLYLTHFPITVLVGCLLAMVGIQQDAWVFLLTIPLCLAISFPVACVFYNLVECHYVNAPSK